MKVLIVDDSARIRKLIMNMLAGAKTSNKNLVYEFFECDDGINAFAEYSRLKPNWVIMDISMKRMNGLDAVTQIKNEFPDAQIMIVTNYDDARFRKKAESQGIKHYVLKENLTEINDIVDDSQIC